MVFFQQSNAYNNPTQPVNNNRVKYQEEPDWAPAPSATQQPPPYRQQERDASIEQRRPAAARQNDRESASYAAAVKAVNDCILTNSGGNNSENDEVVATTLKGLWRVFDAGVGELGAELNDSLANKAIFEGELDSWY